MGRQTQLHLSPKDVNVLLVAMHDKEPLEVAVRSGSAASLERLAFIPENMTGTHWFCGANVLPRTHKGVAHYWRSRRRVRRLHRLQRFAFVVSVCTNRADHCHG